MKSFHPVSAPWIGRRIFNEQLEHMGLYENSIKLPESDICKLVKA